MRFLTSLGSVSNKYVGFFGSKVQIDSPGTRNCTFLGGMMIGTELSQLTLVVTEMVM
jgi:hypothetical protein